MEPRVWTDPRFTVMVAGQAPLVALPVGAGVAVDGVGGDVVLGVAGRGDRLVERQVGGRAGAGAGQRHGQRAARRVAGHRQVPVAAPAAVGANSTLTVQEAPAASEAPQLLVSAERAGHADRGHRRGAAAGLDTVTVCARAGRADGLVAERHARRRRRQRAGAAAAAAAGEDLELGELRGGPAGVAGEAQLHVPGAGPGRQADRRRVAGGRVEGVPGRADELAERACRWRCRAPTASRSGWTRPSTAAGPG